MKNLEFNSFLSKKYFKLDIKGLFLLLLFFLVGLFFSGLLSVLFQEIITPDIYMNFIQPIIWCIPFIIALVTYYMLVLKPDNLNYNFRFKFSKWYYYPLMALFFIGGVLINEPIANAIPTSGFGGVLEKMYQMLEEMERMLIKYPYSSSFIIVILAPIFEELFFRGVILKGLLNNKTQPWIAIVISAFIFGIIHFNPWQFIGAFLLGLILGFIYYKTQSIVNTILLHALNNGLGIYLFYNTKNLNISEALNFSTLGSIVFGMLLLIIFGGIFYALTKNRQWKFY